MSSGRSAARAGLACGAALSILGNVAHTVLTASEVSLWQRIPFAVVWPAALFLAVEILVRVQWRNRLLDWIGRVLLVGPVSAVAAIVSYLHLHHLMIMSGEPAAASILGPVAVDGLMLGSTVALLAIREALLAQPPDERAPVISPPKISVPQISLPARSSPGDRQIGDAVEALLGGATVLTTAAQHGVGQSTLRRYARVIRLLRENPDLMVDHAAEKVRPGVVEMIKERLASS